MPRLICADAIKHEITKYHAGLKPRYISKLVDAEIADIQDIIDETPTVDAVEVVRCKDCLCAGPLRDGAEKYFKENCLLCALGRGTPTLGFSVVSPDEFCSDGIKKVEE